MTDGSPAATIERQGGNPLLPAAVGAAAWGLVGVLALLGVAPAAEDTGWRVAGGFVVGALLAGGNVLLLRTLLHRAGAALLSSGFGWGMVWAGKLGVLALLLHLALRSLRVSAIALAIGATTVVIVLMLQLRHGGRHARTAEPLPASGSQGGEHAR